MQFVSTNNFFQKIFKLSRNISLPTWSFAAHRLRSGVLEYTQAQSNKTAQHEFAI